jgi:DMSO/TMAO reductase YedYZ molybdopterin-dependent catalytic subunit
MALFVVRHQHPPERCPAQDPYTGATLLNYLSRPNVQQHGVKILSEAVAQGQHTLFLIVEAADEATLRAFMQPFQMAGSVDVYPASTCARVVASGGCGAAPPASEGPASLNPEDACQQAIEAGLVVRCAHPLNAETSIPALIGGGVMPNMHYYVRNHFQMPKLDESTFRLRVSGHVDRPISLTMRELHKLPSQTEVITLECAGNGRTLFEPAIVGEKWDLGAVSTAEWTGVPLAEVLDRVGVQVSAREVLFKGADGGSVDGRPDPIRFERSLSLADARGDNVLLAYAMNGEPLPIRHGYPLRLIVPGWYAVASVKWLTDIELIDRPFEGHYQVDKYWYEWTRDGKSVREPVAVQRIRALIAEPGPNATVPGGDTVIRGVAWSGAAPIARVEVSVGDGDWRDARLVGDRRQHGWQWWELVAHFDAPGERTLRARATDMAGHTQPERAEWNRLGYGNNSIQTVPIRVV